MAQCIMVQIGGHLVNLTRKQLLRALLPAIALPLGGCARPEEVQTTVFHFDTVCTMGGLMDQGVLDEAKRMCERFEQLFSRTILTSDVARVNAAQGVPVRVDYRTVDLVRKALEYCEASDGLFDITIGAVSELWDFTKGVVPAKEQVKRALPHVGWERVRVDDETITLEDPRARLDLGGIAKGYIADQLIERFERRGVTSAFVNLGGNVKVLGAKADGTPWHVGVRDPEDEAGTNVVARVATTGGSLVTSGLYERCFEHDGKRYWHILDPRTGYPVQTDIVSASIFSQESIDGDGYTKPLFMLGERDALDFMAAHPGLQALLVRQDGTIVTTESSEFELV